MVSLRPSTRASGLGLGTRKDPALLMEPSPEIGGMTLINLVAFEKKPQRLPKLPARPLGPRTRRF